MTKGLLLAKTYTLYNPNSLVLSDVFCAVFILGFCFNILNQDIAGFKYRTVIINILVLSDPFVVDGLALVVKVGIFGWLS